MKISLAFGRSGLTADIPDDRLAGVLTMRGAPPVESPEAALAASLAAPIGGPPLAELARGRRSACVVICDITRPVPNSLILPPILRTLEEEGIARDAITILIATGLHRPSTSGEREQLVGPEIAEKYRIVDHHAREQDEQQALGTTRNGTPVAIDRIYCEAELKITTGFIEPHLMAGFSGGRKLIAPGCAWDGTIKALHSPSFLENPECREGSIEENPLHHELLAIAELAGHDFIVNVSLDQEHRITGIFSGEPLAAHAKGITFVRSAVRGTIPEPADIVVTTAAGYPLDLTYYQAIKGMTAALPVVREGGTLILVAECAEGLGSPEFVEMATSFPSHEAFTERLRREPVVIDQWQLEECAKAARKAEVILVSPRVASEWGSSLFVTAVATLDEALSRGRKKQGEKARIAVIPHGPYTLVEAGA